MKLPPERTPVIVRWEDCYARAADQFSTPAELSRAYKPMFRNSIGYFAGTCMKDGREAIAIATDDDRSQDESDAIGGPSYIPLGMVVGITVLHEPIKRKRK